MHTDKNQHEKASASQNRARQPEDWEDMSESEQDAWMRDNAGKQAQHSPLPWQKIYTLGKNSGEGGRRHIHIISGDKPVATLRNGFANDEANAAHIVNCVNNAETLAEALRECLKCHSENAPIHAVITAALAKWEAGQ